MPNHEQEPQRASSPDTSARGASRFYRPELDAFRFLAFLLVFSAHLNAFPMWFAPVANTGSLGLPLFFLLSSYLIVFLLLRESERTSTVSVRAFAMRRILRIWPLYLLAIVIALVWPLLSHNSRLQPFGLLSLLTMSANFYIARHGWMLGLLVPLWSISVEEQFYVVIPWFGKPRLRRWLGAVLLASMLLSYVTLVLLFRRHTHFMYQVWVNSFVQFQFFAAGGLLALWNYRTDFVAALWQRALLFVAGAACFFAAAVPFGMHDFLVPGLGHLLSAFLTTLVGTTLLFLSVLQVPLRIPAPLLYLGKISFGLYVFHWFAITAFLGSPSGTPALLPFFARHIYLGIPAAMVLTLGLAMLSFHCLELPVLRLKKRFEIIKTR